MEVYDEMIHKGNGVRMQCVLWAGMVWNIYCNDRFEPGEFESKIHCEICGPERFNPKLFEYRGHCICKGCLTRFIEMIDACTTADCKMDRKQKLELQKKIEEINNVQTNSDNSQ